jgi:UDP-2,4-diacetamido-2,4,6-trideoxy-beta-L-altropyranose hydrolase
MGCGMTGRKMQTAIARADGSKELGLGHLIRSLTLLQELRLRGWSVSLATRLQGDVDVLAARPVATLMDGIDVIRVPSDRELTPSDISDRSDANILIVDHYGLDAAFEANFAGSGFCRVVMDDFTNRQHDCEFLINPAIDEDGGHYNDLVPPNCRLLTGSQFVILRPEFLTCRRKSLRHSRTSIRHVAVSLGATDSADLTLPILKTLDIARSELPSFSVSIMMSSVATNIPDVQAFLAEAPDDWRLMLDAADVGEILASTDLAIGSFGTSSWERACLGVPTIAIPVAANQNLNRGKFEEMNAVIALCVDNALQENLVNTLRALHHSPERLLTMSAAASSLCDGIGCVRIADAIEANLLDRMTNLNSQQDTKISLRKIRREDRSLLYSWQCHPDTRRHAREAQPPTWDQHCMWFESRMATSDDQFMVMEASGQPVGVVRLDPNDDSEDMEVSIYLSPDEYGNGYAQAGLRQAQALSPETALIAFIMPENTRSLKLFARVGFQPVGNNWFRLPSTKRKPADN